MHSSAFTRDFLCFFAASGDLALYHATYHFSFTDPASKQPVVETGNWVALFKRQPDGSMKMSKDIVADTPKAEEPAR